MTQPTFGKGWYRYGLILHKLDRLGEAGVAYKTAVQLSQYQMNRPNESKKKVLALDQCKSRYLKFIKFLRKKKKKKALQFMADFGKDPEASSMYTVMKELERKGIDTRDMDMERISEEYPEMMRRQELGI